MTVQLNQSEFQRLVRIIQIQPEFASQAERRNLITLAFGTAGKADAILSRLNLGGTPMGASVEIVNFLCKFGQIEPGYEALGVFLDQLLINMGISDEANFMADIIERHNLIKPTAPLVATMPLDVPDPIGDASSKYVFISYARPDQSIADQVENYLKAAGFRVFRDIHDVPAGDNWDIAIENALISATHMVLLLSAASMPYRKEVYREWFFFEQKKKPILPLYVQDCSLHSRMFAYNYIDARTDLNGALSKLVREII